MRTRKSVIGAFPREGMKNYLTMSILVLNDYLIYIKTIVCIVFLSRNYLFYTVKDPLSHGFFIPYKGIQINMYVLLGIKLYDKHACILCKRRIDTKFVCTFTYHN